MPPFWIGLIATLTLTSIILFIGWQFLRGSKTFNDTFEQQAEALGGQYLADENAIEAEFGFSSLDFNLVKKPRSRSSANALGFPSGNNRIFFFHLFQRLRVVVDNPMMEYLTVIYFPRNDFAVELYGTISTTLWGRTKRKWLSKKSSPLFNCLQDLVLSRKGLCVEVSGDGLLLYWPSRLIGPNDIGAYIEFTRSLVGALEAYNSPAKIACKNDDLSFQQP